MFGIPALRTKQPSEVRHCALNFSTLLANLEVITSIISFSHTIRGGFPSDLIITEITHTDDSVTWTTAAGTHGKVYKIEILVRTNAGQTFEHEGWIDVRDK